MGQTANRADIAGVLGRCRGEQRVDTSATTVMLTLAIVRGANRPQSRETSVFAMKIEIVY